MAYTFDGTIVSDLHKDARGFRPGSAWWAAWRGMDDAGRQEEWDRLCREVEEEDRRRTQREAANLARWQDHIQRLMRDHGIDRARAILWDMQAMDAVGDAGYYCFRWDIGYHNEHEINDLLGITRRAA